MRISKTLKFSITLAFCVVFSAMMVAAQQYEVLRADYGYRNQRVDVTRQLRDIARSNSAFRMGNSTFGIDPSPGHVKSLRIFARDSRGRERTLEYREGSTVDGSLFSGWGHDSWGGGGGGGDDSGEYTILHAEYGTERNHVDVTNRLRELARADLSFRMGNSTFDTDPDPGRVKTLRIYTRGPGGRERMFEYREGSTVEGSQFSGWRRGDWGHEGGGGGGWEGGGDSGEYVIRHAEYGTERNHVDVTNRLRELARADLSFRMGNSTFDTDPDPGRVKTLRIYTRGPGGRERMFEYREGSTVDGSQFRGWGRGDWGHEGGGGGGWEGGGDSGEYVILRAEYGTERRHVDVTNRLRELARADRSFRMGNSTFDTDPDPGHVKTLRIYTRGPDGRERMFEYREGSTVDGSQFKDWDRGDRDR